MFLMSTQLVLLYLPMLASIVYVTVELALEEVQGIEGKDETQGL